MIDDTTIWDEFDTTAALIEAASDAAAVFGPPTPAARASGQPRAAYRRYARVCHPDAAGGDRLEVAQRTFVKLNQLWRQWQVDATALVAGTSFGITTREHQWVAERRWGSDELCDVFLGREPGAPVGPVWMKVPRRPADSDLMAVESRALAQLTAAVDPRWSAYFPRLLESLRLHDAAGGERRINVVPALDGFCSLAEVIDAYPEGVDPKDAAWMWRRLLVALGAAHRAGVIHAGLFPTHVFIHPQAHGLVVADWYYAVDGPGQPVTALVEKYRSWYPPEVLRRSPVGPATDLALSARLMAHLIGPQLPEPLRAFVAGCTLPDPAKRPDDAWRLLAEFDELIGRLWGRRRFRPFHVPTPKQPTN